MSILVLQSSWWGRESWLLCLVCLPGVSWILCGSSSRCIGFVCSLYLWYFRIILTIFIHCTYAERLIFVSLYFYNANMLIVWQLYFEQMACQIPLFGIRLVKWHIVLSEHCDKRDDFNFEIADFPCLSGDVSRSTCYDVYIIQLFRARVCFYVCDFHNRKLDC